jgi:hypothetical protein
VSYSFERIGKLLEERGLRLAAYKQAARPAAEKMVAAVDSNCFSQAGGGMNPVLQVMCDEVAHKRVFELV